MRRRLRSDRAARLAAALLAAALAGAGGGCRDPGARFDCTCSYLTDFDDASKGEVSVCAPSAERAPAVARGCAQSGAPAPVQGCACRPAAGACGVGECVAR